jgi:hypothetical protein
LDLSKVPAEWWNTEEGQAFQQLQKIQAGWIEFLRRFDFDCWFTITFREPAQSAMLACDRAVRALRCVTERLKLSGLDAFIVGEGHRHGGAYHAHGMLALHALDEAMAKKVLSVFWKISFDLFGINRFSLIRERDAVRKYVSKYITKAPGDWRIVKLWIEHRRVGRRWMPRAAVK